METHLCYQGEKKIVWDIISAIHEGFNKNKECYIQASGNYLSLKWIEAPPTFLLTQTVIQEYEVPLFIVDPNKVLGEIASKDPCLAVIIEHIKSGTNSAKKIAILSNVELQSVVLVFLQNLLFFNFIKLVDIFAFGNVYVTTTKITELRAKEELQLQCIEYTVYQKTKKPHGGLCKFSDFI